MNNLIGRFCALLNPIDISYEYQIVNKNPILSKLSQSPCINMAIVLSAVTFTCSEREPFSMWRCVLDRDHVNTQHGSLGQVAMSIQDSEVQGVLHIISSNLRIVEIGYIVRIY